MTEIASRKILMLNLALLLGVAAILFRGYLPVADEITGLNQQLKSLEKRITLLKDVSHHSKTPEQRSRKKITALPESEVGQLSRELAALAIRHEMKLIQIEPDPDHADTITRLKIRLTPYTMGFSGQNARQFANLLSTLTRDFPELVIQNFSYDKNVGTVDAELVTSSQEVRLFAP